MTLRELESDGKIIRIDNISITEVKQIFYQAVRFFNTAKRGFLNNEDELVLYVVVYDSTRMASEALLLLKGYRIKKGSGYHARVFDAAKEILDGQLSKVLSRIERRRSNRNRLEYGATDVSRSELLQAIKDAEALMLEIDFLMKKQDKQQSML